MLADHARRGNCAKDFCLQLPKTQSTNCAIDLNQQTVSDDFWLESNLSNRSASKILFTPRPRRYRADPEKRRQDHRVRSRRGYSPVGDRQVACRGEIALRNDREKARTTAFVVAVLGNKIQRVNMPAASLRSHSRPGGVRRRGRFRQTPHSAAEFASTWPSSDWKSENARSRFGQPL